MTCYAELPVLVDTQLTTLPGGPTDLEVTEGQSISVEIPAFFLSVDVTESVTLTITLLTRDGSAIGRHEHYMYIYYSLLYNNLCTM